MIICFSGTGNTLFAAERIAGKLHTHVFRLEGERLLEPESVFVDTDDSGEDVIWAFPTYSWGLPPVVVEFIKKFRAGAALAGARHFMLTTCGDDMGLADRQWRGLMARRGFRAAAAYSVIMPNTYVCMKGFDVDSPETVRAKLDAAAGRLDEIADSMMHGGSDMLHRGSFAWIKTRIIYPWFVRHEMSPRPFHATGACTGCGTCARLCPMENITMDKNDGAPTPRWGSRCAMCLRCYHACPHHAVAYGRTTDGKGRQWLGLGKIR